MRDDAVLVHTQARQQTALRLTGGSLVPGRVCVNLDGRAGPVRTSRPGTPRTNPWRGTRPPRWSVRVSWLFPLLANPCVGRECETSCVPRPRTLAC